MADPDQHPQIASSGIHSEESSQMEASISQTTEGEHSGTTLSSEIETPVPPLHKTKVKVKHEKTCGVCGDKALGYNFNAITCESCKAFFRRNAFKDESIKCLFDKDCVVDIRTRRFCPACRIEKCFRIGMNRDMILDDRERNKRRQNKGVATTSKTKHQKAKSEECPFLTTIKTEPEHESMDGDDPSSSSAIEPTDYDNPYARMQGEKTSITFRHPPSEYFPEEPNMYPELTEKERETLDSITNAYRNTMASSPAEKAGSGYTNVAELLNHSELVVRKLIMFVKYLDDFKGLTQEDQIGCLKNCVMNSILLRSALYYSIEKDAWQISKDNFIPTSILKSVTGFVSLHNHHVSFCRKIKSMAEEDLNLYTLMEVLLIFDPNGRSVLNRRMISSVQDSYLLILKHYLESRFSYKYAKEYFQALLECLCDVQLLSDDHGKALLQVNPLDVEPLMLEVLNLK